uniref:Hexosyltransferase n=1 Tax=Anopheles atroparvus TaxID=41427 RepID=A0A182JHB3_ANOAO
MGWFEKFTLFCVILVITSLSLILIGSVELMHRLDDRINGDSLALLEELHTLRLQEVRTSTDLPLGAPSRPLLSIVIRSSRANYELRKTIRRTWAQEDYRLVHRFVLVPTNPSHGVASHTEPSVKGWLARHNRRATKQYAQYFLFVDETIFVNTRVLMKVLERTLPTKGFVLCAPRKGDPQNQTAPYDCDTSRPVLLSGDVVRNGPNKGLPPVHDGNRLHLSRRDTEAILHRQIADITRLVFFFSAPMDRLCSIRMPPTLIIQRLWEVVNGNFTSIDA